MARKNAVFSLRWARIPSRGVVINTPFKIAATEIGV